MSCSRAPDEQQVGAVHLAHQRRPPARPPRAGAGRRCSGARRCAAAGAAPRPTRAAAGRSGRPGRAPPTPAPAAARRRAARRTGARASSGHGSRQRRGVGDQPVDRARRQRQPGAGRAGRHPQHQQRVGARVGLGGEHRLAVVLGEARPEQPQHRLAAAHEPRPLRPGGLQRPAPGDVGRVGDGRRRRRRPRAAARRRRPGRGRRRPGPAPAAAAGWRPGR